MSGFPYLKGVGKKSMSAISQCIFLEDWVGTLHTIGIFRKKQEKEFVLGKAILYPLHCLWFMMVL